jgi:hypothetical protein
MKLISKLTLGVVGCCREKETGRREEEEYECLQEIVGIVSKKCFPDLPFVNESWSV